VSEFLLRHFNVFKTKPGQLDGCFRELTSKKIDIIPISMEIFSIKNKEGGSLLYS
jgi:hypothetical protein